MKKELGITLIALIVTIIVLIILAGVAISMLTDNNGVLNSASQARVATEISTFKEKVNLAQMSVKTEITSKMMSREGYIATAGSNTSENFVDLAMSVAKEFGVTVIDAKTTTADTNINKEGYTVAYYLDESGNEGTDGSGYIVIWYTSNSLRASIDMDTVESQYKLANVASTENKNRNQVELVSVIKVENYSATLSNFGLTSIADQKDDITNNQYFKDTSLNGKLGFISSAEAGEGSKYPVYSIGQEVTVGGESFYVLEASDSTQSTVTLLAKYNLNQAGTAQAPNASYEDTKSYFSSINYWESEYTAYLDINTISGEVAGDAIYKAKQYAKTVSGDNNNDSGRLLRYNEADTLKTSYGDMIWGKANQQGTGSSNYYLYYWLSSVGQRSDEFVCNIFGDAPDFNENEYDYDGHLGVRPVITVPKSKVDIEELNKYFAAGPGAYCDDENGTFRNISGINIDCSKIEDGGRDSSDGWIFKYNNNYYILNIIDEPWSATVSLYNT